MTSSRAPASYAVKGWDFDDFSVPRSAWVYAQIGMSDKYKVKWALIIILVVGNSAKILADEVYLGLIGGSTVNDNKDHYLEQAKLIFEVAKTRKKKVILSFSNGPQSLSKEGILFDYKALYENEFGKPENTYAFVDSKNLPWTSFAKDFDGDKKGDVAFSGTREGMFSAVDRAVDQLKSGDLLNVYIGDHGGMGDFLTNPRDVEIFDVKNSIEPFVPMTLEELIKVPLEDWPRGMTYSELLSHIESRLKRRKLLGKVSIKLDAHNCHGGGVVGLSKPGVCATAANSGTNLSSGIPDPYKIARPKKPLADLRAYEFGGYWHFFYRYLRDHPEASQMKAFWHSTFRDFSNTPVSSLDLVLKEHFEQLGQINRFEAVFDTLQGNKFAGAPFELSTINSCSVHQSIIDIENQLNAILATFDSLPLSAERKSSLKKYQDLYDNFKNSSEYRNFLETERKLTKELNLRVQQIANKFNLGDDFNDLSFSEKQELEKMVFSKNIKDSPQATNAADSKNPFTNIDWLPAYMKTKAYKEYTDEKRLISRIQKQVSIILRHREQLAKRFKLYAGFIRNSSENHFQKFKSMEACLEAKN